METQLKQMKEHFEEIAGQWNGDEAGSQEDKAHEANDITEMLDSLIKKIEDFENL